MIISDFLWRSEFDLYCKTIYQFVSLIDSWTKRMMLKEPVLAAVLFDKDKQSL